MRSSRGKRRSALALVDSAIKVAHDEFWKAVLDVADLLEPMVRDGRIKDRKGFVAAIERALGKAPFASEILQRYPFIVPAMCGADPPAPRAAFQAAFKKGYVAVAKESDDAEAGATLVASLMVAEALKARGTDVRALE